MTKSEKLQKIILYLITIEGILRHFWGDSKVCYLSAHYQKLSL